MHFDHVARRAGGLRDDRRLAPREQIEQRRLAGIGRPDDRDGQAVAQPLAAAVFQVGRDLGLQPGDGNANLVGKPIRQILVGKVDGGLEVGERPQTLGTPVLVEPVQGPVHLLQCLPSLRRRLGRHQIGDALGLGEIELSVLERAARELARLGHATESEMGERIQRRPHDGAAAMEMQLGHRLSGLGVRRGEPGDQRLVEDLAGRRIAKGAQDHPPGFRQGPARELLHRLACPRAAQPDDRERARMGPRGRGRAQRIDRRVRHVRLGAG